jgi:hypothetical protein
MASNTRVLHIQRGFRMSKNYAEQVMRDHCTITWVTPGETIRDTTTEERMALLAEYAQQAKLREPLSYSELPGLRFDPPIGGENAAKESRMLVQAAREFAAEQVRV